MNVRTICEGCRNASGNLVIGDDDRDEPYRLCGPCANRLRLRALRPIEWFNLAATHGWAKYLLHDDFYDQDGEASQPDIDDYSSEGLLAPNLDQASKSLPRLIDFCVTRWWVGPAEFAALQAYPRADILREIERRADRGNSKILEVMLILCANVLDRVGADWVRAQYDKSRRENILFRWCEAAARCLPEAEGLTLAIKALQNIDDQHFRDAKSGLLWFRSQKVLDWIEANAPDRNVTADWGRLAALSDLDLVRARKWITAGRPLSLVALDALSEFIPRPSRSPIVRQLDPVLGKVTDRAAIASLLDDARRRDSTPRTAMTADFVSEHLDELRIN